MKKLYGGGSGGGGGGRYSTVHPFISDQQLSFLPATILSLAACLSSDDREVLAYLLLSSSSSEFNTNKNMSASASASEHGLSFNCSCFRCYMSYWIRWDSSSNRQLIHQIIEAFENHQHQQKCDKNSLSKKKKKKDKRSTSSSTSSKKAAPNAVAVTASNSSSSSSQLKNPSSSISIDGDVVEETATTFAKFDVADDGIEQKASSSSSSSPSSSSSSVRKLVSFVGQKIWNVWLQ